MKRNLTSQLKVIAMLEKHIAAKKAKAQGNAYMNFLDQVAIERKNVTATLTSMKAERSLIEETNSQTLDEAIDFKARELASVTIPQSVLV